MGKAATASSEYSADFLPAKAVDGNPYVGYFVSSETDDDRVNGQWWAVDLGAVYDITKIVIYNRHDWCAGRAPARGQEACGGGPRPGSPKRHRNLDKGPAA